MNEKKPSYEELLKENENLKKTLSENKHIKDNYQFLIDNLTLGIVYQNNSGEIIYANKASEEILGLTLEQLQGRSSIDPRWKSTHEDGTDFPGIDHPAMISIRTGKPVYNTRMKVYNPKTNSHLLIKINSFPQFRNKEEKPFQVFATLENITEIQDATEQLIKAIEIAEENEEKYRSIIESSPTGIHLYKLEEKNRLVFQGANPSADKMLGINHNILIGKTIEEAFPALIETEIPELYRKIARREINNYSFETPYKEGSNLKYYNVHVYSSQLNSITVGFVDITDLKKYEKELIIAKEKAEDSEIYLYAIIENQPGLVWLKDINGKFQKANTKFLNSCGITDFEQLIGKTDFEIWPNELAEKYVNDDLKVINSAKSYITEELIFDKGIYKWFETFKTPVFDELGKIIGTTGYSFDITDRKNSEKELIKAKEKAEESDRLKTAFLQNVSHEVRTPMNAICGFSELLNSSDLNEEKKKNFITIIKNSSNQLLSIINDILTISSLETKQEKINIQQTSVNDIIVNLISVFKIQAQNKNLFLYSKQDLSDKQSEIYTDKTKLIQILTNLITNALKFTHTGYIEFGYNFMGSNIEFYVKDTGIGIKPELQSIIFERFRQADKSIQLNYGGSGLGLAISKAFVELMGGKIWVNSELNIGSTFYFTIPYKPVNVTDNISNPNVPNYNTKFILVAEDEEYNFLYLEELLKSLDCKLIHSKNGIETIEICNSNKNISLILMDIKMPLMDGHEAAVQIKKTNPKLPIIAQSAYALEHERNKYEKIFDDYITKPIEKDELINKVLKYISV